MVGAMITIVSGTNRPGSNTRKIVREVEGVYAGLGEPCRVVDLVELPPEIFHPTSYATKPASFEPFAEAILTASGVVVVTPEYNGGVPGVLKYFIDMLKFPGSFEGRPVCLVGLAAGMWGALRPVEQLQLVFGYRNACLYPVRVFFPGIGDKLEGSGRLREAELRGRLEEQARGFIEFVKRLRGPAM
jgi:chromate reductase, NAD(P)H dehydrogenase (quinone)